MKAGKPPSHWRCLSPRLFVALTASAIVAYLVVLYTAELEPRSLKVGHLIIRQSLSALILGSQLNSSDEETMATEPPCEPVHQIIFIKTHKTASTTTNTLIQRYGMKHNLSFALPAGNQLFNEAKLYSRSMLFRRAPQPGSGDIFNILANHMRYNRPELEKTVPDAKYITILRHPVTKFESTFGYYNFIKGLHLEGHVNPLETFMKTPETLLHKYPLSMNNQLRNGMMFTLGFDHKFDDNETVINKTIERLDKELDLVLLTEYYDESLLLLKELMCWEIEDILYIPKGYRSQNRRYEMSDKLAQKILKWNRADERLYDHFNRTFWRKVEEYGPNFGSDLDEFRRTQKQFYDGCVDNEKLKQNAFGGREDALVMKRNSSHDCEISFMRVGKFHYKMQKEMRTREKERNPESQTSVKGNIRNRIKRGIGRSL
ncbi:galactosylceramide sulfotransferase-like isoform X1 [Ptychodera flava]|uniref:galactosylceramide sulfotransferase-like isoform X1 n=1 Tax=Ptychodera flava TaxID=63121 RepID=UPI00396A8A7F